MYKMRRSGRKSSRRKTLDKNPLHECNMEGIFDPRFDYFVRRKESQNCESGDCVFRLIALQSSIIKGLLGILKPRLKKAYS